MVSVNQFKDQAKKFIEEQVAGSDSRKVKLYQNLLKLIEGPVKLIDS